MTYCQIQSGHSDIRIPVTTVHTLVIGTGAASLCCAGRLHAAGITDLLIVTDNLQGGTSRNTGSDKQTYYKLADASPRPDSPYEMARALAGGGCMHGDIALIEAQCSLNAFYHLISLGVPFPHNPWGGYTGYKTDHDPNTRGTSLGPYTSKAMVEALLADVTRRNIPLRDSLDAIQLLVHEGRAAGLVVLDKKNLNSPSFGLEVVLADNIVLGAGGPGGLYETSVYPRVHRGGIGLALEAGAEAVNLTESQFGLASVKFRWNLSGSYQQVLPSYYSTDAHGNDKRYFLNDYFDTMKQLCRAVFLKGYQWPFDPAKIEQHGSSLIDILVYIEREQKGRRVFMDFRENPAGNGSPGLFDLSDQDPEVQDYLSSSGALGDLPIDRLESMNQPAIDMYKSNGIDLGAEALEIAVCAQHNNGGLAADIWWESTNISHLFPVGEINGTHGVHRPGGSALNSGQVGALRASEKISASYRGQTLDREAVSARLSLVLAGWHDRLSSLVDVTSRPSDVRAYRAEYQHRMTKQAGFIRSGNGIDRAVSEALAQVKQFYEVKVPCREMLPQALRNRLMVLTHYVYLSAVRQYLNEGGGSRGSCLVLDEEGREFHKKLPARWHYRADFEPLRKKLLTLTYHGDHTITESSTACRLLPEESFWFESMWKDFREGKIFQEFI